MSRERIRRTLEAFRFDPVRGRAVVAVVDDGIAGYALLASFWSNEYGGEIVCVDELYVADEHRNQGIATALVEALARGKGLWPSKPVALELEVTPRNVRARALYERLGFRPLKNSMMRRFISPTDGGGTAEPSW